MKIYLLTVLDDGRSKLWQSNVLAKQWKFPRLEGPGLPPPFFLLWATLWCSLVGDPGCPSAPIVTWSFLLFLPVFLPFFLIKTAVTGFWVYSKFMVTLGLFITSTKTQFPKVLYVKCWVLVLGLKLF